MAWVELKESLRQEQPFKFIYVFSIKILDWLENKLL